MRIFSLFAFIILLSAFFLQDSYLDPYLAPGITGIFYRTVLAFSFFFAYLSTSHTIGNFLIKTTNESPIKLLHKLALGNLALGLGIIIICLLKLNSHLNIQILFLCLFACSLYKNKLSKNKLDFFKLGIPLNIFIYLLGVVTAIHCIAAILPMSDWDSSVYQATFSRLILEGFDLWNWPSSHSHNYPQLAQLMYTLPLAFGSEAGMRLISFVHLIGIFYLSYLIGIKFFTKQTVFLSITFLFSSSLLWGVGSTARVENILGFYSLLAMHSVIDKNFRLACLFTGIAVSVKLTGLVLLLPILFMSLFLIKPKFIQILVGITLFLIPTSFFFVRNYIQTEAVFFPYQIASNGLQRVHPKEMIKNQKVNILATSKDYFNNKEYDLNDYKHNVIKKYANKVIVADSKYSKLSIFSLKHLIFDQRPLSRKNNQNVFVLIFLGLLTPFLFLKNSKSFFVLSLGCVIYFFGFGLKTYVLRYFIPIFPILSLSSAYLINLITSKLGKQANQIIIYTLSAYCLLFSVYKSDFLQDFQKYCIYLTGKVSDLDYIKLTGYNKTSHSYGNVISYLNANIPEDRTVLLLGEQKSYLVKHKHESDFATHDGLAPWRRLAIEFNKDHEAIKNELMRSKTDILLINHGLLLWDLRTISSDNAKVFRNILLDLLYFLDQHSKLIFAENGYWLVKITPESS